MARDYYIITGTSRGIGESVAHQLLGPDNVLYCISRNQNPRLTVEAYVKGWSIRDITLDLNDTSHITSLMRDIFREINEEDVKSIVLVNNAGVVHPIREIGGPEAGEKIIRSMNVNLTAAMLITDVFIRETNEWKCPRKIVNMSSGAAIKAKHGWSAYCTAKAGLEMFTKCLLAEQEGSPNPARVISFLPGVVNTEMQAEIRAADPEIFPEHDKFVKYKEQQELLEPEYVADKLIEIINAPDFGASAVVDVRTYGK